MNYNEEEEEENKNLLEKLDIMSIETVENEKGEKAKKFTMNVGTLRDTSSAKTIARADLFNTLKAINDDRKCSNKDSFIAIALLCQMGGTSPRAQGGMQVKLDNTTFSLDLIKKVVKTHTGKSLRRFAKTYANEFYRICVEFGIPGNLTNKLNLIYCSEQPLNQFESIWASDYQSDNPRCPKDIRDLLTSYYNDYVNISPKGKKK